MNELLKLKPIKPNVPIKENFFNLNYIFLLIGIVLIIVIAFYLKKYIQIKKEKKELFNLIHNPKKFAYEFTKQSKKFQNKKNSMLLKEILIRLQEYKYKKEVKDIDEETKNMIKRYLGLK